MLKFGNKEFRNLQEQVKKNMDDILFILQEEGVLNEFGIKVVGQEESVLDMPTVEQYKEDNPDWSFGDAYAIGTEAPYELYILTRANGTHPDDYWFNIGEFPVPGPQGEEGPQGETGPQGPTGPSGQDGVSPQFSIGTVSASTLSAGVSATASVTQTGTYAQPVLNFTFGIPEGQAGSATTTLPWGALTGSIANQTDLVSALQNKANVSTLSSYATQVYADNVANDAKYQASLYTDSAISSLGSVYASQTFVTDKISELDYASVGALSSATFIPSVYGTNDGTNWTDLTINGSTYGFAAGGGNAEWGSISGTLTNQTDLMSKFSEYATISDLSSYATTSALSSAVSGLESTISSLNYASVGALSADTVIPDITGLASETYVNNSISALSSVYASQSALSEYAPLSTLSSYATQSWVSSNFLSSGYVPSISGAAMLSEYNIFTGSNRFSSATYFDGTTFLSGSVHIVLPIDTYLSVGGSNYVGGNAQLWCPIWFRNSTAALLLEYGKIKAYGNGDVGTYEYTFPKVSGTVALTSDLSAYAPITTLSSYATQAWVSSQSYLTEETLPTLTLNTESYVSPSYILQGLQIGSTTYNLYSPDLSLYATQSYVTSALSDYTKLSLYSALSSRVDSLDYLSVGALSSATVIPDITGLASEGYVNSAVSGLSSVYAPISLVSDVSNLDYLSVGALSSGTTLYGTGTETWTFTLSDGTSTTKTIVLG